MQLLQELQDKGFEVSVVNGDTLEIVPGSKLTPELIEGVQTEKPGLIVILTQIQMDAYLDAAIARLNEYYRIHGLTKTPTHNEHLNRLESEITRCFQSEDVIAFNLSVDEWENSFMLKHEDT